MVKCCSRQIVPVIWKGLRNFVWLQIWKGERKVCSTCPTPVGTEFKFCSHHILVKITVLVIFTEISMNILSSWVIMLHHIPEEFFPGIWCIISQKNAVLNRTAVITLGLKKWGILMLPSYFTSYCSKWIELFYFCSEYRSGVNCSTDAKSCAGTTVENA